MGATYKCSALFFYKNYKMNEKNNADLRPRKMRGVAFPKSKYGVILAIIVIIIINIIYYKETIFSFFKWLWYSKLCQKNYQKLLNQKKLNIF